LKPDLEDLVERARKGERDAFDELVRRERPRLEAFVRGRLGVTPGSGAEMDDVVQEALYRACGKIREFQLRDPDSPFRWLCGIAANIILEAAGKRRRGPTVPLDFEVPGTGTTPSHALRKEERFHRLQDAIDSLSPEHREAILLVRVEGLPVKEVAKRMNRTPHAVSNLILRASRRLKELMGETESLSLPDRRLRGEEGAGHD
jgi:RNA polymerase sigma-70 factor (ECF subfamily)